MRECAWVCVCVCCTVCVGLCVAVCIVTKYATFDLQQSGILDFSCRILSHARILPGMRGRQRGYAEQRTILI